MNATELCLSVAAFFVTFSGSLAECAARCRKRKILWFLPAPASAVVAANYIGMQVSGGDPFDKVILAAAASMHVKTIVIVLTAGVAGYAAGIVTTGAMVRRSGVAVVLSMSVAVIAASSLALLFAWEAAFDIERFRPTVFRDGWRIDTLLTTESPPIRLALDDAARCLYFSTYATGFEGIYSGTIFRVNLGSGEEECFATVAASTPVLYRPFGLACHNGDLYVSRAGHAASAANGNVTWGNWGAVTRVRDLNGDGQFESFHDVISGIPAARAPDTMHQNNGVVFGRDGELYVAVGSSDDRSLDPHPWSGTVLRLAEGSEDPEVFARGLRNPFGICEIPGGGLIVSDNDCNSDPGDELHFVARGSHCGHPYSVPGENRISGFDEPLVVDADANFCGVACAPAANRYSSEADQDTFALLVCDRLQDAVLEITMKRTEDGARVIAKSKFAAVPSPIDIAVSSRGEIYVASLLKGTIYRVWREE